MRHSTRPIPNRTSGRRGGVVALAITAALLLLATSQWMGCSPERHYKTLSFFFDGVPDPNAPPSLVNGEETDATGAPIPRAFLHKPFAENRCDACHATASGRFEDFDKADDSSCAQCHPNVQTQFAVMHGPVAIGGCSFCHVPHESSIPALLVDAAPAVCMTCHDRELLPVDPPDHQTDRSCLDCHVGHGSDHRGLLRPGVHAAGNLAFPAAGLPTTSPAVDPAADPAPVSPAPSAEPPGGRQ